MAIANQRRMFQRKIEKYQTKLTELQNVCQHGRATKTAGANTGNYSRADSYWWDFECPDCGCRWRADQ